MPRMYLPSSEPPPENKEPEAAKPPVKSEAAKPTPQTESPRVGTPSGASKSRK